MPALNSLFIFRLSTSKWFTTRCQTLLTQLCYTQAFTFLQKRLKPLEQHQKTPIEFKDLCYLLTTKSIHDAPSFKNWEGIAQGRDKLIEQFQSMLEVENSVKDGELEK